MPFFKSHPPDAGPANVFTAYPEIYQHWAKMGQALMNGPSPFTPGEREMIAAYVVGLADCRFAFVAHSAVAYAWGIEDGLLDKLLADPESASVEPKLRPLLAFVAKLAATPGGMTQGDADAVFAAGWDEQALHDAIAITARAAFMQRPPGRSGGACERCTLPYRCSRARGFRRGWPRSSGRPRGPHPSRAAWW